MRPSTVFLLLSAVAILAPAVAAASEIIAVGDTIEISVLGIPEMGKRAIVDGDGAISYPLLGVVQAEGLSKDGLRQSLVTQLINGKMLKEPKIGVEIVARPPFYVTGAVTKPGSQPFAANMTVRSAIALAGGIDLGDFSGGKLEKEFEGGRGQLETIAYDYVRQRAHLLSLEAELTGKAIVQFERPDNLPVSDEVVAKLNGLETQSFETRRGETQKEKDHFNRMISMVKDQLAALAQRRQSQEESVQEREHDITKFKDLADRGILVQGRLLDEQRSLLLMKSNLYESVANESQASRLLEEYEHKLVSVDEDRKLSVIKEVQDAYIATATMERRLSSAQALIGSRGGKSPLSYVIFRRTNGKRIRLDVDEGTDVLPGDVIEVSTGMNVTVAAH